MALCPQALQLLMRVPRVCDLAQIVPQLVSLRQLDAVVELTLKVRTSCKVDIRNSTVFDVLSRVSEE